MAKQLEINGKMYEPSSAVAGNFGYTSDYVSKLAREGKVLGTLVGRQWYVDRNSLSEFLEQVAKQKSVRQEVLRTERKIERAVMSTHVGLTAPTIPKPTHALAQSVAIFAVLFFMGTFSFVAIEERLSFADIEQGVEVVGVDLLHVFPGSEAVQPNSQVAFLGWFKSFWSPEPIPLQEQAPEKVASDNGVLMAPAEQSEQGLVLLDGGTTASQVEAVRSQFSDPVTVRFEDDSSGIITPIFKNKSDENYRFLLVPVKSANE